ncbi:hypothetical protein MGG_15816 [Pyricularia oryzae 70-15]|uniref:Uncharacterized protein n=1 Tax=Pyricularia oryzae (strain 70-15 / ATCC MYA-4617 / FGSC 8958) TaxID=242507 RepID=G4MYB9_PYRO7|nr:uncharacterized protein MGG_15816 [Pyricularia oryzae 70-15]EHA55254.1 hypothetical protein MGG_15816 [Pyricularia oryzae 70-15]
MFATITVAARAGPSSVPRTHWQSRSTTQTGCLQVIEEGNARRGMSTGSLFRLHKETDDS